MQLDFYLEILLYINKREVFNPVNFSNGRMMQFSIFSNTLERKQSSAIDGVAIFFKATSKVSLQGSGKIPDVREALMKCAIYGARKGRALAIQKIYIDIFFVWRESRSAVVVAVSIANRVQCNRTRLPTSI